MISINTIHSTTTIKVGERFDSKLSQEFSEKFKEHPNNGQFVIDLSNTTYIDSSALGALIALHHYVGTAGKKVKLRGIQDTVSEILKMASFDKLFDISA